jgi:hypothetical protein
MSGAASRDYRKCISCVGTGSVVDFGSGEDRPCALCRKEEYTAWVAERQPATRRLARLDEQGRCCGRKPRLYKRPRHYLFCVRCCAALSPETGSQIENWAWVSDGDAFVATSPTSDYAARAKGQP